MPVSPVLYDPDWDVWYLMNLDTRQIIARYDDEKELLTDIEFYQKEEPGINLEVLKAISFQYQ